MLSQQDKNGEATRVLLISFLPLISKLLVEKFGEGVLDDIKDISQVFVQKAAESTKAKVRAELAKEAPEEAIEEIMEETFKEATSAYDEVLKTTHVLIDHLKASLEEERK